MMSSTCDRQGDNVQLCCTPSQFWTSQLFHVRFWLLLLNSHTGFAGYRQNGLIFPSLLEFSTVCCDPYSVFSEEEVEVFLEFPCFLYDPMGVDDLISGSSAFSKSSLYIWKFSVHILLKPSLKAFECNLNSMWNEHNCLVIWHSLKLPLWDWNENWPFPVLWPLLSFSNLLAYWEQHFNSIIF